MASSNAPQETRTVVVVDTFDRFRPTTLRVARCFSRAGLADVLIAHWSALDFSDTSVALCGSVFRTMSSGAVVDASTDQPIPVDALYFFAAEAGALADRDLVAIDQFRNDGVPIVDGPTHVVIEQVLVEASRRGVATNAL